jgi:NAD(P)-dependent dehydrogenase (short-subunit alcohol dehydrogenase family)
VASITQTLGPELAPESIFVNAIVPSVMNTPTNREAMPDADHSRWPTVQEAAEAVVYLLSAANNATYGAMVPIYGRA